MNKLKTFYSFGKTHTLSKTTITDGVIITIPIRAYKGLIFKIFFTIKINVTFKINPKILEAKNLLKALIPLTVCLSEKVHFI